MNIAASSEGDFRALFLEKYKVLFSLDTFKQVGSLLPLLKPGTELVCLDYTNMKSGPPLQGQESETWTLVQRP